METEIKIMQFLAKYTYLSKSQLIWLWIKVSDRTFYKVLARLREPACWFIATRSFAPHPKHGAREDIHYLKPRGRKYLIEQHKWQPWDITIPIGSSRFYADYDHRKRTIRIQILLSDLVLKNEWNIILYTNYFTWIKKESGKWRESSTKTLAGNSFLRADSIILIQRGDTKQLFCLEVHNGYDIIRIVEQLKQYWKALSEWSPSKKYKLKVVCRVLVVFEHLKTLQATVERLHYEPYFRYLKSYFLFHQFDQLQVNPSSQWLDINRNSNSIHK